MLEDNGRDRDRDDYRRDDRDRGRERDRGRDDRDDRDARRSRLVSLGQLKARWSSGVHVAAVAALGRRACTASLQGRAGQACDQQLRRPCQHLTAML